MIEDKKRLTIVEFPRSSESVIFEADEEQRRLTERMTTKCYAAKEYGVVASRNYRKLSQICKFTMADV